MLARAYAGREDYASALKAIRRALALARARNITDRVDIMERLNAEYTARFLHPEPLIP
jgi:hypothetical protein